MLEYPPGPSPMQQDRHTLLRLARKERGKKQGREKKSFHLGTFILINSILVKYEEILLTADCVWFFWSDFPNNTHSYFDMSVLSGTLSTEVTSDQKEL